MPFALTFFRGKERLPRHFERLLRRFLLLLAQMDAYHVYERIGKGRRSVAFKGRRKKSLEYIATVMYSSDFFFAYQGGAYDMTEC